MTNADGIRKRGRTPTGWTQVGVKTLPEQLARVDAWIAAQPDRPNRPEAFRRLIDLALAAEPAPLPGMSSAPRLALGDRVRSDTFGLGRIVSPPRAMVRADPTGPTGVVDAGWRVQVAWDAAEWGTIDVSENALERFDEPPTAKR
ncbi:MAG: hypothetical protein ABIS14_08725 [Sphingomonas sp.]